MPDLPTPQGAEAALFSEAWDAVFSYADLCTSGSATAHRLATEAFTRGMREVRAAARTHVRGAGRRTPRLPTIPALLTAVRATAARWQAEGQGHRLDPGLSEWLDSAEAARHLGPPRERPAALRALRDLAEADAALLWLAEVEALPPSAAARRLGLEPATVSGELERVRTLFRDRCRHVHGEGGEDGTCWVCARAPGAAARAGSPGHPPACPHCAGPAARHQGAALAPVLAGAVIGWGSLAYLERRRRASEVRQGTGRPAEAADGDQSDKRAGLGRLLRGGGLFATAVLLSALALAASLMPYGGSGADSFAARDDTAATRDDGTAPDDTGAPGEKSSRDHGRVQATPGGRPAAAGPSPAPAATLTRTPATPGTRDSSRTTPRPAPDTAPPGAPSPARRPGGTGAAAVAPAPTTTPPASCHVAYALAGQWPGGFQATVTVTAERALAGWRVDWSFPDGQQVTGMWDATARQTGARVTATAADYDRAVPARTAVSFGFTGTWAAANRAPGGFTLNGAPCAAG
ncbi:cellulose binding domain-containing protein [Streptomyces sp. NEAU-sy36]|uniref:cellulose-binding domain-containing protein n=1 Tax=unclassified Streptomyces TaxID=2593676 RepID=UPI0015D5E32B|nr:MULTISPECIES: cellulose-binding domain-containing protein [unclassified Streptomyces]QLJ04209.1 cellulose binding domain-containing protein [Streptomyces sp. NEAU-sy36]